MIVLLFLLLFLFLFLFLPSIKEPLVEVGSSVDGGKLFPWCGHLNAWKFSYNLSDLVTSGKLLCKKLLKGRCVLLSHQVE